MKRVDIGREVVDHHVRLSVVIDHMIFWADIPAEAFMALGIREACRRAKKALHEMALQRRLHMLAQPGPSRMVH